MKLNKALKIIIACGGFLFVCIFISINAHAQEIKHLPYDYSWNYIALDEEVVEKMLYQASRYIDVNQDNVIVFWWEVSNSSWLYNYCVAVVDDVIYTNNTNYDNVNLTEDYIVLEFSESYIGQCQATINGMWLDSNQAYAPTNYIFFGRYSSLLHPTDFPNPDGTYLHMPLYGTVQLDGDLIIGVPQDLTITGSATAPTFGAGNGVNGSDFLVPGADFGASVSQATKPTAPTITNYTWNTYNAPSVDTSSIETLLQSLIDIVKYNTTYIVEGITGLINNLISNINNLFAYIGALIEYSLRVLVTNIQNAIQNMYENFKSLVEPIFQVLDVVKEKVEYITEPYSEEEWQENYDNCEFISAYDNIQDNCEEIENILKYAEEREYYHLYLTFPKPDGTNVESMISFDWLYPLRSSYRPFLWVIVLVELFVTACRLLGSIVGGKAK